MQSPGRTIWKALLSVGVSLLLLGLLSRLLLQGTDPADRPRLVEVLRQTAPLFVGLYFALALVQAALRALRYRVLIAADEGQQPPGLPHIMLVTLVRNMLIDLLPARIGELSYVAMMNRGYHVKARTCLSSLAVGFVFDFVALFFIIVAILGFQLLRGSLAGWLLSVALLVLIVICGMLAALFAGIRIGAAVMQRLLGKLARHALVRRALEFLAELADSVAATRRAGVLGKTLLLSMGVRLCKYTGLYCMFRAVAGPSFEGMARAPVVTVISSLLAAEGTASLPVPSFMSFGTYEAGGALALTALGFEEAASLVAMLAIHIWSQSVDYLLGGTAFVLFLFLVRRATAAPPVPAATRARFWAPAAAGLLVVLGLGVCAIQYRHVKKMGSLRPPDAGQEVQPTDPASRAVKAVLGESRATVVWSSNRTGNHDIHMMSLPDRTITRLTTNAHVDYFPRISPDGRQVVFSRSQAEWVSQRNYYPWDVYRIDIATGAEHLVARGGNTPTWSDDGSRVYFQRDGNQFVEHTLATGAERIIFQSGRDPLPAGTMLETPDYSEKRQTLAVTLRKARRGTVLIDAAGAVRKRGGGCQFTWSPTGDYLFYVDNGGRQQNMFYRVDPASLERTPWLDLAGDFSHEYFGRISNDGRFLVLGASTGGHEHDSADYEIFLWRIGAPAEEAVRLTFHTGNDCWPDIHVP